MPDNRRNKSGKSDLPGKEEKASLLGRKAGWSSDRSGFRGIEGATVFLPLGLGGCRFCCRVRYHY